MTRTSEKPCVFIKTARGGTALQQQMHFIHRTPKTTYFTSWSTKYE